MSTEELCAVWAIICDHMAEFEEQEEREEREEEKARKELMRFMFD